MSTNYIDQITDTAGTTHDISEGDSTRIFRATCTTAASTAAKVATLQTSSRNFSLATGVRVAVTFTYGNSATTPTLNVSSTGAKTIAVASSATAKTTGNGTTYNTWGPYETVLFTYDGTYWVNGGSSRSIYNAYNQAASAGTGTVTSVGITAGTGISVSNSPVTTSGSITVGHSNSVTAQTTQAVYPIKIDAQGHISGYGSAVTIPTDTNTTYSLSGALSSNTYTSTLTAGGSGSGTSTSSISFAAGTGISLSSSGSTLTITNTISNTDVNVTNTAVTAASTYYLTGGSSSATATGTLNKHASINAYVTADSGTTGSARITIGNSTASGTAGAKYGYLRLYGDTAYYADIRTESSTPTANRTIYLPSYAGTMYLTCTSTTSAVGGANNPVYVNATGQLVAGNSFVPNTGGSFTGDVSMAGTTAYTTANVKNIVESTDAPGTASSYPTGTVWLQYGTTPPSDQTDYVVEQGTSGIWTYRKWNSGISECWGTKTVSSIAVSTAWGNIYYGTASAASGMTYPSGLFTAAPIAQINLRAAGGRFWSTHANDATATNVGTIYAIAPTSYSSQTIVINIYSMGAWK